MSIRRLREHPRNPRTHPKQGSDEWEALKKSLEHDYFDPIVFNRRNGFLVSGHLRYKVLLSMGIEEVDVVVVDYDENTHLARMIAANTQSGQNDWEQVAGLLEDLKETGMDIHSMAMITAEEMETLLAGSWEKPEVRPIVGQEADGATIKFNKEQWQKLSGVLNLVREDGQSDADCIVMICTKSE